MKTWARSVAITSPFLGVAGGWQKESATVFKPYIYMAECPAAWYVQNMESSFERNADKDAENQRKHGVSFAETQLAFLDPQRVIARDVQHSDTETRYYCFGEIGSGVLTVRFTWRKGVIRIIGAGYWRRGRKIYEAQR